jgi:predicted DNA binding CopG/RHH family protein
MAEKKNIYPNPKFSSREEEDKYWATHSPLDEGYEVEAQREKQKRSSFLTIRLTGEELTQLRDLAGAKGMGPSTFIRTLIKNAIGPKERAEFALRESECRYQSLVQDLIDKRRRHGRAIVKDKAEDKCNISKDIFCIMNLSEAPIMQEKIQDLARTITLQFISDACVKIITPDDTEFDEMKRITVEETRPAKK